MAHYAESPARLRHPLRHWKLSVLGKHSLVCEEARAVAVTTARTRSAADPETRLKLWRLGKSPVNYLFQDLLSHMQDQARYEHLFIFKRKAL